MDEQKKKKMLMIGGVVALAVVIIIAAAVMMDHKKKVEQSPMIVNRESSGTLVSTLATTAQGITTTAQKITTIPVPIQKKYYIQSTPATGSLYLKCKFGEKLSTTTVLSEATPVTFSKCGNEYCLMSGNQNVNISPGGMISTDGEYTIYIHSLSEKTYIGLVDYGAYLDLANSPIGFTRSISTSDASIWNVVAN